MKLHEIIEKNSDDQTAILVETLLRYKKSLFVYYSNMFPSEPCLMVTNVFNAVQYAKIVPSDEINDAVNLYVTETNEEDREAEIETILFNSVMLRDVM